MLCPWAPRDTPHWSPRRFHGNNGCLLFTWQKLVSSWSGQMVRKFQHPQISCWNCTVYHLHKSVPFTKKRQQNPKTGVKVWNLCKNFLHKFCSSWKFYGGVTQKAMLHYFHLPNAIVSNDVIKSVSYFFQINEWQCIETIIINFVAHFLKKIRNLCENYYS